MDQTGDVVKRALVAIKAKSTEWLNAATDDKGEWWECLCLQMADAFNEAFSIVSSEYRRQCPVPNHHKTREFHGMSHTKEYRCWTAIRQRCENPNDSGYCDYGGRGIAVCDRWQKFTKFYEDMGECPEPKTQYSIERLDVNVGYEPGNCTWLLNELQGKNTRSTIRLTHEGKTKTIHQWAKETGLPCEVIRSRVTRRWSAEKILTTPKAVPMKLTHNGKSLTIKEWSSETGVSTDIIECRMSRGMPLEKVFENANLRKRTLTLNGETHSIIEWSRKIGIHHDVLYKRLRMGWTDTAKILQTTRRLAAKPTSLLVTLNGETLNALQWSQKLGIPYPTIVERIKTGKTPDEILYKGKLNQVSVPKVAVVPLAVG